MDKKRNELTGWVLILVGVANIVYGGYYQNLHMLCAGGIVSLFGGCFYILSDLVEDMKS